ncbi:hypothetical protein RRG08_056788 [Elysia crispata]|uniref:Uncharacterized protein n=1 Tax=Elysia crispata TaxID=231223 RepID=A0AAE1DVT4_9GAST|nr:hypothetical protein RRG08_056788 [Elysia crispata]
MLYIANSLNYDVDRKHYKYFEPGHSFMTLDAAHCRIEKQMRRTGKLFDFRDIVEGVTAAKCEPVRMTQNEFVNWKLAWTLSFLSRKLD